MRWMRERDWLAETREKRADVRELAGKQGRDGIRTYTISGISEPWEWSKAYQLV